MTKKKANQFLLIDDEDGLIMFDTIENLSDHISLHGCDCAYSRVVSIKDGGLIMSRPVPNYTLKEIK